VGVILPFQYITKKTGKILLRNVGDGGSIRFAEYKKNCDSQEGGIGISNESRKEKGGEILLRGHKKKKAIFLKGSGKRDGAFKDKQDTGEGSMPKRRFL